MKKLLCAVLLVALLAVCLAPVAFAADGTGLVTDSAGLLSAEQHDRLSHRAAEIADAYQCDVAIITLPQMQGDDAFAFAQHLYDQYDLGYGAQRSGLLLFLSMDQRDYALMAYGYGNTAFTDHGKDVLLDGHVLPLLAQDRYYDAFTAYLDVSAEYLAMARADTPFDIGTDEEYGQLSTPVKLGITLLVPLLIAGIVCSIWKGQMKTARLARAADRYIPANGFALTAQEDRFLYRTQTQRTIQRQSSSGGGGGTTIRSGGASGRSGKF